MTIRKGRHRPAFWWLHWPLWFNRKSIGRIVTFTEASKYDLKNANQDDHNKLFGIGYFPSHHKESARFGWRYSVGRDRFILSAYCYVNGMRSMQDICEVPTGKYMLYLTKFTGFYAFDVIDSRGERLGNQTVNYSHKKQWCFPLGLYFGGNETVPKNITLEIKKV